MLFNSIEFAIFLPIVFVLYWFVTYKQLKVQNALLFISSYIFYGWWDWRFLSLIMFSSFVDFFVGVGLSRTNKKQNRKILLFLSIFVNLGFLGFFKYFNFFSESFVEAFTLLGKPIKINSLNIILPVGISFYTFQTLGYSIDVYKKKLKPTKDLIAFLAFVSFFPQLVAGPIERAANLLPQFYKKRVFEYDAAVDGMRQILWGLFKKVVIADNCAYYANIIFANSDIYSGSTLIIGAIFFAFQIYGDFSGYSDIAIGVSRLFGFNIMRNFAFPYFSRDIAEFWRRWHISLSSWFKDYLYIPLGGSRGSTWMKLRNIFIIFIVSGFWHGAKWTFIIWGVLNAIYFIPLMFLNRNRNNIGIVAQGKLFPTIKEFFKIILTFSLTLFGWIFFRSENINHALSIVSKILSKSILTFPYFDEWKRSLTVILLVLVFIILEWLGREEKFAIANIGLKWPKPIRWIYYSFIVFSIGLFMQTEETPFIYFQF